jgi:hypothetical protein
MKMNQEDAVNFNSQETTPNTLVSTFDDPGKYDVDLAETAPVIEPKDIPQDTVEEVSPYIPRRRTILVPRFYTLMQAWGPQQVAWEDDARLTLVINVGSVGGVYFSDNINNLNTAGIASGIGIGRVFVNQVVLLEDFTGPLYILSDVDSCTVSVTAVTVQR